LNLTLIFWFFWSLHQAQRKIHVMESKTPQQPAEPEVVIDWTPLDTSRSTPVWLIKVPRVVAELWETAPEGAELGRLHIHDPGHASAGEGKVMLTADINPFATDLPSEWEIPFNIPSSLNIFTEDVAGIFFQL
jgi:hypothetical protein